MFHRIIPVCSLTNIQKLIICQLVRNKTFENDIDFEFDEKQQLRCEKQTISYRTKSVIDGLENKAVSLVRCPVVVISRDDEYNAKIRMIYSPHLLYMSNCADPNCLMVYGKKLHEGDTKPSIDAIHADFPINAILNESKTIDRKLTYPTIDLKTTQKTFPPSLFEYKNKLPNYPQAYQLNQSLSRTEKEVLNLFEIINMTSPYRKFKYTIQKYNPCELSRKKKIEHCILTYENQLYKYKIDRNVQEDTDMRCIRSEVLLNEFEGRQNLALLQCPVVELEHFEGLYLSGGVTEKTMVLFSQSTLYRTINPTALAPDIPLKKYEARIDVT